MGRTEGFTNKGSLNNWLSTFLEGERRYVEVEQDTYLAIVRRVTLKSRYPNEMAEMEFSSQIFTAVSANRLGDVRLLVCVTREK